MLQLDGHILREIGALSRCIQTMTDGKFRENGLQKGQFIFITRICENQGINMIELSHILKVDKTTTTKAVGKLIEAGFVEKKRDAADLRMWKLYPCPKALELYGQIISEENKNIRICFSTFSEEDKASAYRLVRKMLENLEVLGLRKEVVLNA